MLIKLFGLYCFFASSIAWLAPERCAQNDKKSRISRAAESKETNITRDIKDIAGKQHEALIKTYKDHEFIGVPIRGAIVGDDYQLANNYIAFPKQVELHAPFNCTFHTYDPELLSNVACNGVALCKLSHTVTTVDTYTASEGYNWGVKFIANSALIEKIFEIGGEASTGGTYSCTYNKGRSTTDLVECSDSGKEGVYLQLYRVKSDMVCDFGGIYLEIDDDRDKNDFFNGLEPKRHFTFTEIEELQASVQVIVKTNSSGDLIMIDTNKISDNVLQKFKKKFPLYNPYTDLLTINEGLIGVAYYKKITTVQEYRRIVPFTNESGNSVYQYACNKVPI